MYLEILVIPNALSSYILKIHFEDRLPHREGVSDSRRSYPSTYPKIGLCHVAALIANEANGSWAVCQQSLSTFQRNQKFLIG
jgi:hypothetical protein